MHQGLKRALGAAGIAIISASVGGTLAFGHGGGGEGGGAGGGDRSERTAGELQRAVDKVTANDFAAAATMLTTFVDRHPQSADGWNYLGFTKRKLGKYPESLAAYEKALALDPNHKGAHEYLGELYVQMGDVPKAKELLVKLEKLCGSTGCLEYQLLKQVIDAKVSPAKTS